ncbi:MAG: hypothetical protein JXQ83_08015, partial [Candidatus Glassbacteria bacterium]|nr:hypothetical protein [Candidatus Glassbacteria bacterium]
GYPFSSAKSLSLGFLNFIVSSRNKVYKLFSRLLRYQLIYLPFQLSDILEVILFFKKEFILIISNTPLPSAPATSL